MNIELLGRALTTLPEDDDHPYRTGPWRPQAEEYRADDLEVIGDLPTDLDGVYLRNTENPVHPAIQRYHPFDGDGMVHMVGFRDGSAFYRNRFVRTEGFLAEQEAGRSLWAGIAEDPRASERDGWGARGRMKDASSTDIVVHAGEALTSFYQCGDLYRLDPLTLETMGRATWDGRFPAAGVSAHPKVDDATGEMMFFNYGKQAPYMHYGVVDADNRLVHYTDVPLPGPRLPHDMAVTEHYAILNDCPLHWDVDLLDRGIHAARMHDAPTRFAILPRRGTAADIRWFEADPTYVLHWTNAYEEGDEIVLEGFFQDNPEPKPPAEDRMRMFRYLALDFMQTRLHRWRFNLRTGQTTEEHLREEYTEFGMINEAHLGRPYRWTYAATGEPGWFLFNGLVKHDMRTGADERFRLEPGVFCSETVMAPRVGSTAEDDGYLVTITVDVNRDRSEAIVLDAANPADGPIARVVLPQRVSSGTHATWASGEEIRGWSDVDRAADAVS